MKKYSYVRAIYLNLNRPDAAPMALLDISQHMTGDGTEPYLYLIYRRQHPSAEDDPSIQEFLTARCRHRALSRK